MHSDTIFKLQLVTSSGLNLAQIPETEDTTQAQLSSGIMTAILTFSKEVHERDIEFLSYYDRSIVFVPINDLIIVAEVSSSIDNKLLRPFMEMLKEMASPYLSGVDASSLQPGRAQEILGELYEADWMHTLLDDLGYEKSLINTEKIVIEIDHKSNGRYSILNGENEPYLSQISSMIHEKNIRKKVTDPQTCGFMMLNEYNKATFAISINGNDKSKTGLLVCEEGISKILFRMTPLLIKSALTKLETNPTYDLRTLLDELSQIHDIDPSTQIEWGEYSIPLTFLENTIKNVDRALFSVVSGAQTVIVGNKAKVEKIIEVMLLFNQHLITDIINYYEAGDLISNDITGMSKKHCEELTDKGVVDSSTTIIDIEDGTVKGTNAKSNSYLKNLYSRTKNLPYSQAREVIARELDLVVSYALTATSYLLHDKTSTLKKLEELKASIKDNDQYEIIQLLATKQNKWLSAVVYDTSFDSDWI